METSALRPESIVKPGTKISDEWELDVYSRPVVGEDGKKLWELLLCDSTGSFRHVSPIPSNMVNSREVRKTVEAVIETAPGGSRPSVIRFFRNAMFNMIDIALREVDVAVRPCRTTYAMYQWLEERERDVYPNMPGFRPNMKQTSLLDIRVSLGCVKWYIFADYQKGIDGAQDATRAAIPYRHVPESLPKLTLVQ